MPSPMNWVRLVCTCVSVRAKEIFMNEALSFFLEYFWVLLWVSAKFSCHATIGKTALPVFEPNSSYALPSFSLLNQQPFMMEKSRVREVLSAQNYLVSQFLIFFLLAIVELYKTKDKKYCYVLIVLTLNINSHSTRCSSQVLYLPCF